MKAIVDGVETELPDQITTAELTELLALKQGKFTGDPETDQMLRDCIATMSSKGKEYTIGSKDRLANFRRVGEQVDQPMEKVWFTYFYKHYSAVVSYIKNGCKVQSNETIQSRIMDCIVYLLLFNKMSLEIERQRAEFAAAANQGNMTDELVKLAVETYQKG